MRLREAPYAWPRAAERPAAAPIVRPAPVAMPFWLRPTVLLLFTLGLPTLIVSQLPNDLFVQEWKVLKYFTTGDAWNIAIALLGFGFGAALIGLWGLFTPTSNGEAEAVRPGLLEDDQTLRMAFYVAGALTLTGTVVWIAMAASHGVNWNDVLRALGGDSNAVMLIRRRAVTLPGVTTMSQFGIAMGVLAGLLWFRQPHRGVRWFFTLVVTLTLLRALLRAERLALLEVVVPFSVALLPGLIRRLGGRLEFRLALLGAPFAGVAGLFLFFMAAEAGRSYESKVQDGMDKSLAEYSALRIASYYTTALNNGAYLSRQLDRGPMPHFALDWFWKFPGVESAVNVPALTGIGSEDVSILLNLDLNPEFNNASGFFCYRHDFGPAGVVGYFTLLGALAGWLFANYRRGRVSGLLLYPLIVNVLLEMPRIPYMTAGRLFPTWCLLLGLVVVNWVSSWRLAGSEQTFEEEEWA